MKILSILLLVISITAKIHSQSTITIGTGTDSQNKPFDMWYGYTRSAAIYSAGEMGGSKFITSLGWEVATGDVEISPVKIYLKLIPNATLSQTTWSSIITGATLVYNTTASFPLSGWKTIDIADFVYTSGQNLLVLCESNYGMNGVQNNMPYFAYSDTQPLAQHEGWEYNFSPPTGSGSVDYFRPNIQITSVTLSNPIPPSGFMAQAASTSQVNLNWTINPAGNSVMVAFNTTNTFGTPSGIYVAGNPIAGGGTVIYNGIAGAYGHNTGLNPATTYYYKAWSVNATPTYSTATSSSATTFCVALSNFPDTTNFELPTFPPVCWSIAQKPWVQNETVSAYGIGAGSAQADFYNLNILAGSVFDMISPTLNLSALSSPVVSFDHAYASYSGELDSLELWASTDNGISFTFLSSWLGGASGPLNTGGTTTDVFIPTSTQWASKSHIIPTGTNKILFRGVSAQGNNLYLDNIVIGEPMVVWNGSVSSNWNNPLNWNPNGVPLLTQDVTIPSGMPFNPIISTMSNFCKNLLVKTGATLTVNVGKELTVLSNVVIQNNATMTNNGMVKIKGNLTNQNSN